MSQRALRKEAVRLDETPLGRKALEEEALGTLGGYGGIRKEISEEVVSEAGQKPREQTNPCCEEGWVVMCGQVRSRKD